jgi:hypothetical protein
MVAPFFEVKFTSPFCLKYDVAAQIILPLLSLKFMTASGFGLVNIASSVYAGGTLVVGQLDPVLPKDVIVT